MKIAIDNMAISINAVLLRNLRFSGIIFVLVCELDHYWFRGVSSSLPSLIYLESKQREPNKNHYTRTHVNIFYVKTRLKCDWYVIDTGRTYICRRVNFPFGVYVGTAQKFQYNRSIENDWICMKSFPYCGFTRERNELVVNDF